MNLFVEQLRSQAIMHLLRIATILTNQPMNNYYLMIEIVYKTV